MAVYFKEGKCVSLSPKVWIIKSNEERPINANEWKKEIKQNKKDDEQKRKNFLLLLFSLLFCYFSWIFQTFRERERDASFVACGLAWATRHTTLGHLRFFFTASHARTRRRLRGEREQAAPLSHICFFFRKIKKSLTRRKEEKWRKTLGVKFEKRETWYTRQNNSARPPC